MPDKCTVHLNVGDVVRMLTPAGGGWGELRDRRGPGVWGYRPMGPPTRRSATSSRESMRSAYKTSMETFISRPGVGPFRHLLHHRITNNFMAPVMPMCGLNPAGSDAMTCRTSSACRGRREAGEAPRRRQRRLREPDPADSPERGRPRRDDQVAHSR